MTLRSSTAAWLFAAVGWLGACSTVNPHYNPAKPHHRPDGFQNNYTTATDKSRWQLITWQWQA
jgi:N-acyl-phosphatidylethanolamine-hydrolysing phospholipase D